MSTDSTRRGILLMILTMAIFAAQDGISRHLAETYNVFMVVMLRYWFFAAFVIAIAQRQGGLRDLARTEQPGLQIGRGVLLAVEICVMVAAFTLLGLVESLAVFACYPLLVALLSGPILGERVGPWRLSAIGLGLLGVLIILEPGAEVFSPLALVPLCSAALFAIYSLLTRYAARQDAAMTSFFWTGAAGAVFMTPIGLWFWEAMTGPDWAWMTVLCMTGALGHYLLIRVYELAEASAVQPFAYFQLVFGSAIGLLVFAETIRANVAIGAAITIAAGLFTLWRERVRRSVG
jgi:drug/metabolite transporter (DMT)-like permease